MGMFVAYVLQIITLWLFRKSRPNRVDFLFRILQLSSSAAFSLGHGGNDAQKLPGLSYCYWPVPAWQTLTNLPCGCFMCYSVISLGTMLGGWKVIRTMGHNLTPLRPMGGFCAETAGAITLFATGSMGIPASTTYHYRSHYGGWCQQKSFCRALAGGVQDHWSLGITIPATTMLSSLIYLLVSAING